MQNYRSMSLQTMRSENLWHSKLELDVRAFLPVRGTQTGKLAILVKNL